MRKKVEGIKTRREKNKKRKKTLFSRNISNMRYSENHNSSKHNFSLADLDLKGA
jgi:hypothetical protein